jgi:hypothetical protein
MHARTDDMQVARSLCPCCGVGCEQLIFHMDGNGHKTSFTRDLENRITAKTYDDQSSIAYAYENTTSRLKSISSPGGQTTTYAYYIDNNLKQISYTGSNPPTPTVNFTYDPNYNRVATMTDGAGPTSYTCYPVGTLGALRLASVDGPLNNDTINYGYDEYGRVTNRSINGVANATSTLYDPIGRVYELRALPLSSVNRAKRIMGERGLRITPPGFPVFVQVQRFCTWGV